jgi:hypothetical protein
VCDKQRRECSLFHKAGRGRFVRIVTKRTSDVEGADIADKVIGKGLRHYLF